MTAAEQPPRRFLDRDAVVDDRVWVEGFEATVYRVNGDGTLEMTPLSAGTNGPDCIPARLVRVLASAVEPGDTVTAEMDAELPEGSIIEFATPVSHAVATRMPNGRWYVTGSSHAYDELAFLFDDYRADSWTVVSVGPYGGAA